MNKLKKCFILTQFGEPHPWTQQFFDNIKGVMGWDFIIYTPHAYPSEGNIIIKPMNLEGFDALVEKQCGFNPRNYLKDGRPAKPISDIQVAFGCIFEEDIKDYNFWGHPNWDLVFGNLDHFIPDDYLQECDIFTDDLKEINGMFTVYRNTPEINRIYQLVPQFAAMCQEETLHYIDDFKMMAAVKEAGVRVKMPESLLHSYDRLNLDFPKPWLELTKNHSLIEKRTGKEIITFHFSFIKSWPL